jgi:thiosulfate dehydrogenase
MNRTIAASGAALALGLGLALGAGASADEFKKEDVERWGKEYLTVVTKGRELFTSPKLGTNGVACAQCHPNAANTHPETYPKFQTQLKKVALLRDMVNWCILNPLEGKELAENDPKLKALEAYILSERNGIAIAVGKH